MTPGFDIEIKQLLVAVGRTDRTSTRLWLRDALARTLTLELSEAGADCLFRGSLPSCDSLADNTVCVTYPRDFDSAPPLEPGKAYRARILAADRTALAQATFETAPEDDAIPEDFAIGLASCHQPFDASGSVSAEATRLLDSLAGALRDRGVRRMLLMGDQMYVDQPAHCSLFDERYFALVAPPDKKTIFDCTREEVRAIMQARYRAYWSVDGFYRLQSAFPCYPMLDDHEIVDNYGTLEEHGREPWVELAAGALDAYRDYQGARMEPLPAAPRSQHYSWEYGPVASFVMDLRSEKRCVGDEIRVYGDGQLEALERYLEQKSHYPVMLVVLTVPLVYVPDPAARVLGNLIPGGNDLQDRWSYPAAHESRRRLIDVLVRHTRRWPRQKLCLLGGDVHVGSAAILSLDSGPDIYQLVSSAVSNRESEFLNRVIATVPRMIGRVRGARSDLGFSFMGGKEEREENPVVRINAGLVRVRRVARHDEYQVNFELLSADAEGKLTTAFESEPF